MDNWLLARIYVKHRRIGVGTVLEPEHTEIGVILKTASGKDVDSMTNEEVLTAFKPQPVSEQYSKYKKATSKESESE